MRARRSRRGQSLIEFVLAWGGVFLPLSLMLIFTGQLLWVWHSVVDYTRQGAVYAATHCYQAGGANVVSWMRENTPPMVDRDQFRDGQAEIEVSYFQRNPESGTLEEFACIGAECSRECVPDAVRVRVVNYQFQGIQSYFGLPPVSLPNFQTSFTVESAGCTADEDSCQP